MYRIFYSIIVFNLETVALKPVQLPTRLVGIGDKIDDFGPFDAKDFAAEMV